MTSKLVDQHLLTKVPTFAPTTKVREVVAHLTDKKHEFGSINYIYIVEDGVLKGVVSIKELLREHADTPISKITKHDFITIHPHATLERAAITAIQHGIKAVPVQDHAGKFLGIVGTDTILHTLHREHTEDLLRIGGVEIIEQKHILEMLHDKVAHLIRIRLNWLVLGLFGGFLATFVVSRFEEALARTVQLAFFMPLTVYMASAVGAQTQIIFIRASAIKKLSTAGYLAKEVIVDSVLAAFLSIILFGFAGFFTRRADLALAVAVAMAIAIVLAGLVAIFIPWLLIRFKRDPALGAGPFATVVQDILSLLVYFAVASALL
ncbi:magnesium transporter [Candidatus Uhrbacteria bacterium]|nr:magnesium transporter [Candidatus Uhrbacteria bacterium]